MNDFLSRYAKIIAPLMVGIPAMWGVSIWAFNIQAQITELSIRGLTWRTDSLQLRLYASRRSCRGNDALACDESAKIEKQLREVEEELRRVREQRGY